MNNTAPRAPVSDPFGPSAASNPDATLRARNAALEAEIQQVRATPAGQAQKQASDAVAKATEDKIVAQQELDFWKQVNRHINTHNPPQAYWDLRKEAMRQFISIMSHPRLSVLRADIERAIA